MKKKFLAAILTLSMVSGTLAGCGKEPEVVAEEPTIAPTPTVAPTPTPAPVSENVVEEKPIELNVSIKYDDSSLDPALISTPENGTMLVNLFSGLARYNENGEVVADAAESLPKGVINEDGTVSYTYTLRDGLKWSDGEALTSSDFSFAWNRAANPEMEAKYGYMFEVIDGYASFFEEEEEESGDVNEGKDEGSEEEAEEKEEKKEPGLNIECPDEKTLIVTLTSDISYWNQLITNPVFMPVRKDVVKDKKWAKDPDTYICNGAYTITGWTDDCITLTKNPEYYDAENVTMETINCYASDDTEDAYEKYAAGEMQFIDDVPVNELEELKKDPEFHNEGLMGTYYMCLNADITTDDYKKTGRAKKAIGMLLDREYIVSELTKSGEIPASSFVAMGITDGDGSQFYENCDVNKDFKGYFDAYDAEGNKEKALEALKEIYIWDEEEGKLTGVPDFYYMYNKDDLNEDIAEYIKDTLEEYGINVVLEEMKWDEYKQRLDDKSYLTACNSRIADYNDPVSFLEIFTSTSAMNDASLGCGDHAKAKIYSIDLTPYGINTTVKNGSWAETYDVLIDAIKNCESESVRYAMMHTAEDMLMDTGFIVPLFYYTDIYMISGSVNGFYRSPVGYKYFMYTSIEQGGE